MAGPPTGACTLAMLLCVAFAWHGVKAVLPGFRTAITEKGLDYVRSVGIPILEKQLADMKIPDQNGKASSPIGKIAYSLSDITNGGFKIGSSSITVAPGSGITVSVAGASLAINAHWHYRMDSWPHVSDSGSCDISVSGVSLTFSVVLGMDKTGHATLSAGSCHCDIGHMDIKFHGGASWLYNLFSSSIAGDLKSSLASQSCSQGKDAINSQGNKALESLPVTVNLDKSALINYALIATPIYTKDYIETQHKGEFFLRAAPTTEAPLTPNPLPAVGSLSDMMYVWLTEYMINTAGYVYFHSNTLHYLVLPSMVPPSIRDKFSLNTATFKGFVPALYAKYPNEAMTLFVNNSSPATVNLSANAIYGSIPGTVQVNVLNSTTNASTEVFVLNTITHFNATVGVRTNGSKTLVVGKAYYLSSELSLASSTIGTFSVIPLQFAVDALSSLGVIPLLNKYAAAGFPLPVVDGVEFTSPAIQIGPGYLAVATDFKYTPTLTADRVFRPQHVL